MKTLAKLLLLVAAVAGIAVVVLHLPAGLKLPWTTSAAAPARQPRDLPVPVAAAIAAIGDVPVYEDGVGTVKALNTVTVRPQIDGKITQITFTEGATVKQGDTLALLDPVTVKAMLDQAQAKKATDDALLANTVRDLDRFTKVGTLGVTQQQIDTQRALIAQQKASVNADQAAIDNAQAQLAYANVTSPIDGVTGIRQVDVGNIVRSQTDPIVVIAQIQPISIFFTLPQQQLGEVTRGMAAGPLTAEALTTDGGTVLDSGTLRVIDNQVDPTTGTIKLKADFPNASRQLWPGQFVSVRLKVDTLKAVVVAPLAAVQQGPSGSFVYLVNDDNTVGVRPVTTGQNDGDKTVVTAGLKAGEKIVTTGFSRLKEGAKISLGAPGGSKSSAPAESSGAAAGGSTPDASAGSALVAPAAAAEPGASPGAGTGDADTAKSGGKQHRHHKNGASGTASDSSASPPAPSQ